MKTNVRLIILTLGLQTLTIWLRSVKCILRYLTRYDNFCNFFHFRTKINKRISGLTESNLNEFVHDVATFNLLLTCSSPFQYSNLFWNGCTTMPPKTLIFRFQSLWQPPLSDRQINAEFIKPLHSCTKIENLMMIHP